VVPNSVEMQAILLAKVELTRLMNLGTEVKKNQERV